MTSLRDLGLPLGLAASLAFVGWVFAAAPAAAQSLPLSLGFAPMSAFAWPRAGGDEVSRRTGSYASLSTGFEAVSSKRFGSYAGPTIGFEGGRIWQDGSMLYGIAGGFNYLDPAFGSTTPSFGRLTYTRDLAGALQVQVGTLLTPDVLLYAKAGVVGAHETLRFGPTSFAQPITRDDIIVRPDARVGVEWAVTDRITVGVEAGVIGPGFR